MPSQWFLSRIAAITGAGLMVMSLAFVLLRMLFLEPDSVGEIPYVIRGDLS